MYRRTPTALHSLAHRMGADRDVAKGKGKRRRGQLWRMLCQPNRGTCYRPVPCWCQSARTARDERKRHHTRRHDRRRAYLSCQTGPRKLSTVDRNDSHTTAPFPPWVRPARPPPPLARRSSSYRSLSQLIHRPLSLPDPGCQCSTVMRQAEMSAVERHLLLPLAEYNCRHCPNCWHSPAFLS